MGKDKLGYRQLKKRSLGTREQEQSLGIDAFASSAGTAKSFYRSIEDKVKERPTALLKWAFDDFVVEEKLPLAAIQGHRGTGDASKYSCLLCVISEGVPTPIVARVLKSILPSVQFHFLSPVDFVSCSKRYVWIREHTDKVAPLLRSIKFMRSRDGTIYFGDLVDIPVDSRERAFPLSLLPDFTYTVVLRNVTGCLAEVLTPLKSIASNGIMNYPHTARHGVGLLHAFDDAKHLLDRDYRSCLKNYVQSLSEGAFHVQREVEGVLQLLDEGTSNSSAWIRSLKGIENALAADHHIVFRHSTGLYHPHHKLLSDFVTRAANLFPKHNDPAIVIREVMNKLVLKEKFRAISDLTFNVTASSRWNSAGSTVAVGDVVADPSWRGDLFEAHADHFGGSLTSNVEREWVAFSEGNDKHKKEGVKIVKSPEEAAAFDIFDVVLPLYGEGTDNIQIPANSSGDVFCDLISQLGVEGFPHLADAPPASYRHMVRKVKDLSFYAVDDNRGWEWIDSDAAQQLKALTYRDSENMLRMTSPLFSFSHRRIVSRPGISNPQARQHFLKVAKKSGMTCVLRATLPRGTPISSLLRETFSITTLSSASIFRLFR